MKRKAHVYLVLEYSAKEAVLTDTEEAYIKEDMRVMHVTASRDLAATIKWGLDKKRSGMLKSYHIIKKTIVDANAITRTIILFPKES